MIQRFLKKILEDGVNAIVADVNLIDDIFKQYDMEQSEIEEIKTWWKLKTPTVKHQYGRADDEFPLFSIVLGNEEETDLWIGNDGVLVATDGSGFIDTDDPDFGADLKSSIWQHTYQILCYSEHPDGTLYMYEIAKAIFISADLDDCGFHSAHFSGMDLAPDVRFIPENLFARILVIRGKREFERISRTAKLGKAFKVGGVHIDKSGSPSDVGDVKTLVTVEDEDE